MMFEHQSVCDSEHALFDKSNRYRLPNRTEILPEFPERQDNLVRYSQILESFFTEISVPFDIFRGFFFGCRELFASR